MANNTKPSTAMDGALKKVITEGLVKKGGLITPKQSTPINRPPPPPPQKPKA